jgi:hypothetical protein
VGGGIGTVCYEVWSFLVVFRLPGRLVWSIQQAEEGIALQVVSVKGWQAFRGTLLFEFKNKEGATGLSVEFHMVRSEWGCLGIVE